MRTPHPVSIDFIAWYVWARIFQSSLCGVIHTVFVHILTWINRPALRDELVKLSQVNRDKVCEIMSMMFKHMEVHVESSLIHDLSNDSRVGDMVSDLRNWTLKEPFFETFPEFRGLCLVF